MSKGNSVPSSSATPSNDSKTPLPIPLAGTLMTRRRLTLSCGFKHEFQVGQRVLDLFSFVEADAADDLVVDARPPKRIFERA